MSTDLVKLLTDAHNDIRKFGQSADANELKKAIEIMSSLEKVTVTTDALRTSGLNTILNELRKGSNAELATSAKKLVHAFKAGLIAAQSSQATQPPVTGLKLTTTSAASNPTPSPALFPPTPNPDMKSPSSMKRTIDQVTPSSASTIETTSEKTKSPNVSNTRMKPSYTLAETAEPFRDNMQRKIYEYLGVDDYNNNDDYRIELAVRIERAVYQTFNSDAKSSGYRSRVRTVLANLKDPKNPYLNERLYNGECKPEDLATINEAEMASDEMKKRREQDEEYMLALRKTDTDMGATGTDMFTCPKCKKSNCTFYQKQTRSADEPMTTFITCLECKTKWRQY